MVLVVCVFYFVRVNLLSHSHFYFPLARISAVHIEYLNTNTVICKLYLHVKEERYMQIPGESWRSISHEATCGDMLLKRFAFTFLFCKHAFQLKDAN